MGSRREGGELSFREKAGDGLGDLFRRDKSQKESTAAEEPQKDGCGM
jgi:hypothetical protein